MYFKLYKILEDRLPAYSLQLQPHFDLRESKLGPYYIVFNKISIPQAVNIQLYTFIIYTLINLFYKFIFVLEGTFISKSMDSILSLI